jgi:hypothetical protein
LRGHVAQQRYYGPLFLSAAEKTMTISMYAASVPVFKQMLGGLSANLAKAMSHAEAKKFDPVVLLQLRLSPDMFPLTRQVQIASDFAKSVAGRLAGVDLPTDEDNETSIADLQARIARTVAFLDSLNAAQFEGSEQRNIVLRPGHPEGTHAVRPGLPVALRLAAVLLSRHHGLRTDASQRRRDRQGRLHGHALETRVSALATPFRHWYDNGWRILVPAV